MIGECTPIVRRKECHADDLLQIPITLDYGPSGLPLPCTG